MTEPKRWTPTRYDGVAMAPSTRGRYVNGLDYDALAADFDRLRDERDRWERAAKSAADTCVALEGERGQAVGDKLSAFAEVGRAHKREAEARRVAGVLADAARKLRDGCLGDDCPDVEPLCADVASALAVFDTLTEEKPETDT